MNSESKVRFVEVDANYEGQRLDNFLIRELKGVPKSKIYRILRKGEVRVNKKRSKPSDKLIAGDLVRIPPVRTSPATATVDPGQSLRDLLNRAILFEDDALIVVNKPSGLAVHGGSGLSVGLIESMRAMRNQHDYLELVHRLDRETSGCLIIAKSRGALTRLHEDMRNGEIRKEYLALTEGKWPTHLSEVNAPLQKNQLKSGERIVRVEQEGKASLTYFEVIKRLGSATLVKARLATGRTHQIRVHAQLSGHAILGDDKYGSSDTNREYKKQGLKRLFLHASNLSFIHPLSEERIDIEAALPEDLENILSILGGDA